MGDICEYMHLFSAQAYEGELIPCDEGNLEWVDADRVPELPTWEGDRVFLNLMRERESFFSLKLVYDNEHLVQVLLDGQPMSI